MDNPRETPGLEEVIETSGIAYPNGQPYTHIAFTLVAWNEGERLRRLLEWVRPSFSQLVIGVQRSDDDTLDIARHYADQVIEDSHHGFGDATFPKILRQVHAPWSFKVDADEWPSRDLLDSLSSATWTAENLLRTQGVWIPFRSSVDGIEYEEQHAHLRLFATSAGWPGLLHSRPPIPDGMIWRGGHIRHDRTLDELVRDYLRYLDVGRGNGQWTEHNSMMIRAACTGTAAVKGWEYVTAHEWWPTAHREVFAGQPGPWSLTEVPT